MAPKGPFILVTVNNAPERAKRLVGRVIADLSEDYTISYVANVESPEGVHAAVTTHKPDLLFTASMWTPEQAQAMVAEARAVVGPQLKVLSLPQGLQVQHGPDAVVAYIKARLPGLLEGEADSA